MAPTSKGKKDLRITLNSETVTLLRRLAGVKETNVSQLIEESLQDYFSKEEIQKLIELFNLEADIEE